MITVGNDQLIGAFSDRKDAHDFLRRLSAPVSAGDRDGLTTLALAIEEAPEKLETAAEDFWRVVLGDSEEVAADFANPKAQRGADPDQNGQPVGDEVEPHKKRIPS
jgi:hypothetical protein